MNDDLDRRFRSASSSLDSALGDVSIPEPTSTRTSAWIPMAAASLIGVLVLGAIVATRGSDSVDVLQPVETSEATTDPLVEPTVSAPSSTSSAATLSETGSVVRVTSASAETVIAPVASITQAFNSDGSLVLLYRTGPDGGEHVVFDVSAWTEVAVLDLTAATDIEDIFWSPVNPSVLHYINKKTPDLVNLDVISGTKAVSHSFEGCDAVGFGETSGTSSSGSALIAVTCTTSDGDQWVSHDLVVAEEVARVSASSGNAPIAFASGTGFVAISDARVDVLGAALEPTGISFDVEVSAYAMVTVEGRDVLAATVFDGDDNAIGTVVSFDLESGERNVIVGPETGWQYPPSGTTLSVAAGNLVAISTSPQLGSDAPDRLDDVIAVANLATGVVTIVAAHGMADGEEFRAWSSPFVALSPDGRSVLFSSDQGTDRVDTYKFDLG